ncbi:MAG: site-2 protease family protein [Flavobacteriales bacterium]|nr:site-2 protease family protein [Flavobacteriales bacterium]
MELLKVKGIPIRIHWSFILILGYVAYVNYKAGSQFNEIVWAIIYVLTLFLCVTLHELGHALAALRYGVKTKSITLYPIGGVAALERIPEKPGQELVVALAGPLVNVIIGGILWLWVFFSPIEYRLEDIGIRINAHNLVLNLAAVNIILVIFNLLPAFPMDGGRVLRSLLALAMDRVKATQIAMYVGQAMAILFVFWGFQSNPFLILIGVFIFFGAAQEYQMVKSSGFLKKKLVADALMTRFTTLSLANTLEEVKNLILQGHEKEFIVIDLFGQPVGIMTRDILIQHLASGSKELTVAECYLKSSIHFSPDTDLDEAFKIMQSEGIPIVPVIENEQMIGVINTENILECIMLGEAMHKK